MPSIEQLEQRYQDNGLKILMVNTRESREDVEPYIRHNNFSFSVLLDSEGTVSQKYSVFGIPAAFLIDKQGKAAFRSMGYHNWNTKKIHEVVDSLIGE
jgi:cytochrome c biogenesis protein CcmG/thiol:disulfide interchange protein DsbE